jgi:hypothetical protein
LAVRMRAPHPLRYVRPGKTQGQALNDCKRNDLSAASGCRVFHGTSPLANGHSVPKEQLRCSRLLHGAKPIEGDDTYRGGLSSWRGNHSIPGSRFGRKQRLRLAAAAGRKSWEGCRPSPANQPTRIRTAHLPARPLPPA